jgi:hypothetical protein
MQLQYHKWQGYLLVKLEEKDHPEDLGVDDRITMDLNRKGVKVYPSLSTITFSVSLRNLTTFPTQSYDCSCYQILVPAPQ